MPKKREADRFDYGVAEKSGSAISAKPVGQIHSCKSSKLPAINTKPPTKVKPCSTKNMMKMVKPPGELFC